MPGPPIRSRALEAIYTRLAPRIRAHKQYLLAQYPIDGDRTIAPDDAMFAGDTEAYLLVSLSALHAIEVALRAAQKSPAEIRRILDLPCGHGRVMRVLRTAFPDREIVACDIERAGVDFCATRFGAVPVYSHPEIERIELPFVFDLIWVGSLFTHLDAPQWHAFLERFARSLAPGGVLVFTTAGRLVAELIGAGETSGLAPDGARRLLEDFARDGFGFARYVGTAPRAQEIDQVFGRSVAHPGWVLAQLALHPELRLVNYSEQTWDTRQDVFTVVRDR
jgi:SAM-dependent methyltransferase